jgi:uncharacterized protein (DUF433 family)
MNAPPQINLLETGIYTLSEAAHLLGVKAATVRAWVNGRGARQAPLIDNQLGRVGHIYLISFANLMELRFVAKFVERGVTIRMIRTVMDEVRAVSKLAHPFASSVVFTTDGKNILARIMDADGAERMEDLKSKNLVMIDIVLDSLKPDIVFDAKGDATAWFPRRAIAPNVVVHPRFSFGRPILIGSQTPTEAIEDYAKVEGVDATAELYEISVDRVKEALEFQQELRRAA